MRSEKKLQVNRPQDHLDEVASLLARGYVRLKSRQISRFNTFAEESPDERDISLDSICRAERSLAGHKSLLQEEVHGCLAYE